MLKTVCLAVFLRQPVSVRDHCSYIHDRRREKFLHSVAIRPDEISQTSNHCPLW
jgi:hypothetical protein